MRILLVWILDHIVSNCLAFSYSLSFITQRTYSVSAWISPKRLTGTMFHSCHRIVLSRDLFDTSPTCSSTLLVRQLRINWNKFTPGIIVSPCILAERKFFSTYFFFPLFPFHFFLREYFSDYSNYNQKKKNK